MTLKTCFVISPIGDAGSATRQRADQIYKYVIAPVLGEEWTVERADRIAEPGIITNQIIDRLVNCDLVIADLSERNPNVFYELAVRHIARKAYVHLIAHDEDIPFDNAPVRAIKIDIRDLDSVDNAKKELAAQVKHAMKAEAIVESPISVSISLSELRRTGNEESVVLQSIVSEISSLRRQVNDIASLTKPKPKLEGVAKPYSYALDDNINALIGDVSDGGRRHTNALAHRAIAQAEARSGGIGAGLVDAKAAGIGSKQRKA